MAEFRLDFEKPIVELENKLKELVRISESNKMDMSEEINLINQKINHLMLTTYANLTPWQRVQMARHPERPYMLDYIERIFTNFV